MEAETDDIIRVLHSTSIKYDKFFPSLCVRRLLADCIFSATDGADVLLFRYSIFDYYFFGFVAFYGREEFVFIYSFADHLAE